MRPFAALALSATLLAARPHAGTAQTHERVSVGDHALDVVRGGHGGPALVFETGLADSLDTWIPMWRAMSKTTTVVAYSRAGMGRSDPGPPDHSVPHAVADLHALLGRLGIAPPYILVARSYGSLIARLYTSRYPKDVAGLVLVDGTHEQQVARFGTLDSSYPRAFYAYFDSVLAQKPNSAEAAEIRETVNIQRAGTIPGLAPLPDIPLAILTSMKSDEAAPYVNGTARGHDVWRELHEEWFRRSHNAIHIETDRSGHDIQSDQPDLVEMAIRFVMERARK